MAGKWWRSIYQSRRTDTVPVMDEEKEKLRAHKTWYTSLYNKLFGGQYQK
jgi:hypothetical protein